MKTRLGNLAALGVAAGLVLTSCGPKTSGYIEDSRLEGIVGIEEQSPTEYIHVWNDSDEDKKEYWIYKRELLFLVPHDGLDYNIGVGTDEEGYTHIYDVNHMTPENTEVVLKNCRVIGTYENKIMFDPPKGWHAEVVDCSDICSYGQSYLVTNEDIDNALSAYNEQLYAEDLFADLVEDMYLSLTGKAEVPVATFENVTGGPDKMDITKKVLTKKELRDYIEAQNK